MIPRGLGKHVWVAPVDNADEVIAKGVFIQAIVYAFAVYFAKISVLALYWRIFNQDQSIRPWIYILAVFFTSWTLTAVGLKH